MILCDSHLHSEFSFDSETPMGALCEEYADKGFSRIALTDHYDIDGIEDGLYAPYDRESARRSFEHCATQYSGTLDLIWGIELGQAPFREENARRFLAQGAYEYVIGSIHNLDLRPDFCYLSYVDMPDEMIIRLYSEYLDALEKTVRFGSIHTLAHVTYPMRYIHRDGRTLDLQLFYDRYRKLFHELIDSGIALEVNTGKVRAGYVTSPDVDLIALYRDCGGELVTVGSDGHRPGDYGADVESTVSKLREMGFKKLAIPSHKGIETVPTE